MAVRVPQSSTNVPPLMVVTPRLGSAPVTSNVPALTVVPPVYVLLAGNINVPVPTLVAIRSADDPMVALKDWVSMVPPPLLNTTGRAALGSKLAAN